MCLFLVRFVLQKCAKLRRAHAFCFILLIPSASAMANAWTFRPGIDLGEIYSDNITLASSQNAKEDFVTEIDPWFSVKGKGKRLKLNLDYRIQNLLYANDSRRNNTYHQLNADGNAVLVENLFYFDANGTIGQQVISPSINLPFDNISASGNRVNYTTYALSPYVHHSFGTSAITEIRYNYNRVDYSQANQPSSSANQYSARLYSGPSFNRVNWSLAYSEQKIDYDAFPNVSLKSAQGQLGYLMASSLNIFGTLGYEDNKYLSAADTNSGRIWNVGFKWAPSPRTSMSATYGQRFFGNNYSGDFKYRSRLTQWEASYVEEITSTRDMQLTSGTLGLVDTAGNITFVNVTFPQLTAETFIRKRSQLSMVRRLRSGSLTIQFYHDLRLFQTTGDRERLYGSNSALSWNLNERSNLNLSAGWERYDHRTGDQSDDLWYAGIGVTRQLSRRVSYEVKYRYGSRNSTGSASDYRENRISAYIHAVF